jgi:hypothetical protein
MEPKAHNSALDLEYDISSCGTPNEGHLSREREAQLSRERGYTRELERKIRVLEAAAQASRVEKEVLRQLIKELFRGR